MSKVRIKVFENYKCDTLSETMNVFLSSPIVHYIGHSIGSFSSNPDLPRIAGSIAYTKKGEKSLDG